MTHSLNKMRKVTGVTGPELISSASVKANVNLSYSICKYNLEESLKNLEILLVDVSLCPAFPPLFLASWRNEPLCEKAPCPGS
jgi:hypothetical protein